MTRRDFFQDVYAVVQHVPAGRVTTYGAIAQFLGGRMSAQMVGIALNALDGLGTNAAVPAHRVVNRIGLLTGAPHFGSATRMADLLAEEGIVVIDNQVQDFARLFWNPNTELQSSF